MCQKLLKGSVVSVPYVISVVWLGAGHVCMFKV